LDDRQGALLVFGVHRLDHFPKAVSGPRRTPQKVPRPTVQSVSNGLKHGLGVGERPLFQVGNGTLGHIDPIRELGLGQVAELPPFLDPGPIELFLPLLRHCTSLPRGDGKPKRCCPIISGLTIIALTYNFSHMSALREWRNKQKPKLTQAGLAVLLDTTQSHVSEIENAEDSVSLEVAGKVFAATGVRVGKMKGTTAQQARAIAAVTAQ
jgi:hypothetical protein